MSLNPPDITELKAIVDWANLTQDVRELSIKFGDVELFISRDQQSSGGPSIAAPASAPVALAPSAPAASSAPTTAPAAPAPASDEPSSPAALAADEVLIKAPMVGIFYASPKPGAPNFVSVGDSVAADSVLCIVEVMKLMSNIEAQVEGTVVRILVENEQAVEFGQPLMVIKRND